MNNFEPFIKVKLFVFMFLAYIVAVKVQFEAVRNILSRFHISSE